MKLFLAVNTTNNLLFDRFHIAGDHDLKMAAAQNSADHDSLRGHNLGTISPFPPQKKGGKPEWLTSLNHDARGRNRTGTEAEPMEDIGLFFNVKTQDDLVLIVSWLLGAMQPEHAPAGPGVKSSSSRLAPQFPSCAFSNWARAAVRSIRENFSTQGLFEAPSWKVTVMEWPAFISRSRLESSGKKKVRTFV